MKTTFCKLALVLAATAGLGPAQAGVLRFQDVVFTTSWYDNVMTLEIDAATPGGNWDRATLLGALGIKGIGRFDSVALTAAPAGVSAWTLSSNELNANGCSGGGKGNSATKVLCLSGGPVQLDDKMVFSFAFTGTPRLEAPHLKVNFLDSTGQQVGDLLSKAIIAPPVVVPPPGTPGTTPGTPLGTPLGTPITAPAVVAAPFPELPATGEVPEPQTFALLLAGLALIGVTLRKRG